MTCSTHTPVTTSCSSEINYRRTCQSVLRKSNLSGTRLSTHRRGGRCTSTSVINFVAAVGSRPAHCSMKWFTSPILRSVVTALGLRRRWLLSLKSTPSEASGKILGVKSNAARGRMNQGAVLHKGLLRDCKVCNSSTETQERREHRKRRGPVSLDMVIRRQIATDLGEDEPRKDERFQLLQKYGVATPRIDRLVTRPSWMPIAEFKRKLNDWYKNTKGMIQPQQRREYRGTNQLNREPFRKNFNPRVSSHGQARTGVVENSMRLRQPPRPQRNNPSTRHH